jgi:hypothetical protein
MHEDGSFSYWDKGSEEYSQKPYPPDMDDTALALASIITINPSSGDGDYIAKLARLLINTEVEEGGPYKTWIIDDSKWNDVDIGVNANIAYLLSLLSVELPNLTSLFEDTISNTRYESKYYHSPLIILFFISRTYRGNHKDEAISYIKALIQENGTWKTCTETALALCALSNFGTDITPYTKAFALLSESCKETLSDPLYRERIHNNETSWYVNDSITQSLIAVAMHRLDCSLRATPTSNKGTDLFQENVINHFIEQCADASPLFALIATEHVQRLLSEPISKDAILLPYIFSESLESDIPSDTIQKLSVAHLLGWIGYKIVDGVMDNEGAEKDLPFGLFCIRSFTQIYRDLFPDQTYSFYTDIMNDTEQSFAQEYNDRLIHTAHGYQITDLSACKPASFQKSLGHALPVLALMLLSGYSMDSLEFKSTKSFFTSFLHARQMHDDAHDYIEDLGYGRVSKVGLLILKQFNRTEYSFPEDEEEFRRIFWHECFPEVYEDIERSLQDAREAMKQIPLSNTEYFEKMLDSVSRAQQKAYDERAKILSFLKAY